MQMSEAPVWGEDTGRPQHQLLSALDLAGINVSPLTGALFL